MNIFEKNKIYSFDEIENISSLNSMIIVDCLKDENMISIEEWDEENSVLGGECLFEFDRLSEDEFSLRWSIFSNSKYASI